MIWGTPILGSLQIFFGAIDNYLSRKNDDSPWDFRVPYVWTSGRWWMMLDGLLAASYISYKFHASYLTWCKRIVQFPLANIGFPRSWTVLSRTLQEYPQPFCPLEAWYWKIEFPIIYIYRSAISSPVHMIWTPPISTMLGQGDEITPLGSFGTIEWVYSKVTTEGFNKPSTSTQRPAMCRPLLTHPLLCTSKSLWHVQICENWGIYIYIISIHQHSPTKSLTKQSN